MNEKITFIDKIGERRLTWFGYVPRMETSRLPAVALYRHVEETRSTGRQLPFGDQLGTMTWHTVILKQELFMKELLCCFHHALMQYADVLVAFTIPSKMCSRSTPLAAMQPQPIIFRACFTAGASGASLACSRIHDQL